MQYMIMNYVPRNEHAEMGRPQDDPDIPAWVAYTNALINAGVMRGGNSLTPPTTAATVRVRDGKRAVHDGPYADSKEQIGGFYIIEVPTLGDALAWAAKNPAASMGAVEVRAIQLM